MIVFSSRATSLTCLCQREFGHSIMIICRVESILSEVEAQPDLSINWIIFPYTLQDLTMGIGFI